MDTLQLWQAFLQTGAPELFLLYKQAQKMEKKDVLDDSGPCYQGHILQ